MGGGGWGGYKTRDNPGGFVVNILCNSHSLKGYMQYVNRCHGKDRPNNSTTPSTTTLLNKESVGFEPTAHCTLKVTALRAQHEGPLTCKHLYSLLMWSYETRAKMWLK